MIVYGPAAYRENVINASFSKRTLVYFSAHFQVSEYDEELCASALAVYSLYNPFGPHRPRPAIALFENGAEVFYHPLNELKAAAIAERIKALLPDWEFVPKPPRTKLLTHSTPFNKSEPRVEPKESSMDPRYFAQPIKPQDPPFMAEMHALVGMEGPKAEIRRMGNIAALAEKRRLAGLKHSLRPMNYVFTGNPGTGKTTFARFLGSAQKHYGMLPRGNLVEVDRSQLVGKFIGHTEDTTTAILKSALGGVLLIDEAYALLGKDNDYGKRAVEALVKFMEDHRAVLSVVVAGYTEEMKALIASNPGLKSRFTNTIHFPDYTPEELVEIFDRAIKEDDYRLSDGACTMAWAAIQSHYAQRDRDFGNARDMRKFAKAVTDEMADRVARTNAQSLDEIVEADVERAATRLSMI